MEQKEFDNFKIEVLNIIRKFIEPLKAKSDGYGVAVEGIVTRNRHSGFKLQGFFTEAITGAALKKLGIDLHDELYDVLGKYTDFSGYIVVESSYGAGDYSGYVNFVKFILEEKV